MPCTGGPKSGIGDCVVDMEADETGDAIAGPAAASNVRLSAGAVLGRRTIGDIGALTKVTNGTDGRWIGFFDEVLTTAECMTCVAEFAGSTPGADRAVLQLESRGEAGPLDCVTETCTVKCEPEELLRLVPTESVSFRLRMTFDKMGVRGVRGSSELFLRDFCTFDSKGDAMAGESLSAFVVGNVTKWMTGASSTLIDSCERVHINQLNDEYARQAAHGQWRWDTDILLAIAQRLHHRLG